MLLDVRAMGHDSFGASRLLLERGLVAATPMRDWGKRTATGSFAWSSATNRSLACEDWVRE